MSRKTINHTHIVEMPGYSFECTPVHYGEPSGVALVATGRTVGRVKHVHVGTCTLRPRVDENDHGTHLR